jgi:hypothetical protein
MSALMSTKEQLHQVIDRLPPEQVEEVWEYVSQLAQQPVAPIYRIHEYAASTGVKDLADQHDHYLYGQEKRDD